jgi:hypothetical protein
VARELDNNNRTHREYLHIVTICQKNNGIFENRKIGFFFEVSMSIILAAIIVHISK